jgi:hypothetical protein
MKINNSFPSDIIMGIYKIENIKNHKVYIGSSKDIYNRWKQHIKMLECGKHHSYKLQRVYDRLKDKSTLKFSIVEKISDESKLKTKEQYYIDKYNAFNAGYNCSALSDNPKYTCRKIRKSSLQKLKKQRKLECNELYEEFDKIYDNAIFKFPKLILQRIQDREYKWTGIRRIVCLMKLYLKYFDTSNYYCHIFLRAQDTYMMIYNKINPIYIEYILKHKRAILICPVSKYDTQAFIEDKNFDNNLFEFSKQNPILK